MEPSPPLSLTIFLKALQEPALLLDGQGHITQVNEALCQLLGYPPDYFLQQPFHALCEHVGTSKESSLDWTTTTKSIREWCFYNKKGEALSLRYSLQEIPTPTTPIYLALLIPRTTPPFEDYLAKAEAQLEKKLHSKEHNLQQALERLQQHQLDLEQEILERQAMEKQLLAAQAKIQLALDHSRELSELKTRFIATASHEFRTPLSSILSSAALIERYTTAEQQEKRLKHVNRIKSSVKNLTHILEDFLSLSPLEEVLSGRGIE